MFCRLNICTPQTHPQQWQQQLQRLNLNPAQPPPLFQTALEQACKQLAVAIAWCNLVEGQQVLFVPSLGLDQLPHGQHLRAQGLPYTDSYAQYIMDAQQPLCINSTTEQTVFAISPLCQTHGIRAYCGVPLLASHPDVCLGVLAVATLEPRSWQDTDLAWLTLLAQWCVAAQERDRAWATANTIPAPTTSAPTTIERNLPPPTALHKPLMVKLLQELAYELRTPLTSIMGMTRVLEQQVYGRLAEKQAEYLRIIGQSGEQLLMATEEMMGLGTLIEQEHRPLDVNSTDAEMLTRQVIQQLEGITQAQNHTLQLSVEPGNRLWLLDKDQIIPAIYHLLHSLLNMLNPGSQVYLHLAWSGNLSDTPELGKEEIQLNIWATHPQLTAYRPTFEFDPQPLQSQIPLLLHPWLDRYPIVLTILDTLQAQSLQTASLVSTPNVCRLLLCCELLSLHQGRLSLRTTPQEGYRYVVKLPAWTANPSP
ncbi:MAG: GAF domain-containing protein [Cyanobacteria bacterium P01_G01_bin.54]